MVRRGYRRREERRGLVLVVVLLLTLALTLLGHATLLVGTAAQREGELISSALQVRRAARVGAVLATSVPWDAPLPALGTLPGGLAVTLVRDGPGALGLVTLEAVARQGSARIGVRRLAWGLRPRAWLAGWSGWIVTRAPLDAPLVAHLARAPSPTCGDLPVRSPWGTLPASAPPPPVIARLDSAELARRLPEGNGWYPEGLHLAGDTLTGLVVTPGPVHVGPGAELRGLVVAGGEVAVAGVFRGASLSGAGVRLLSGGTIVPDPCLALAVLEAQASLRIPVPIAGTLGWIP